VEKDRQTGRQTIEPPVTTQNPVCTQNSHVGACASCLLCTHAAALPQRAFSLDLAALKRRRSPSSDSHCSPSRARGQHGSSHAKLTCPTRLLSQPISRSQASRDTSLLDQQLLRRLQLTSRPRLHPTSAPQKAKDRRPRRAGRQRARLTIQRRTRRSRAMRVTPNHPPPEVVTLWTCRCWISALATLSQQSHTPSRTSSTLKRVRLVSTHCVALLMPALVASLRRIGAHPRVTDNLLRPDSSHLLNGITPTKLLGTSSLALCKRPLRWISHSPHITSNRSRVCNHSPFVFAAVDHPCARRLSRRRNGRACDCTQWSEWEGTARGDAEPPCGPPDEPQACKGEHCVALRCEPLPHAQSKCVVNHCHMHRASAL
jgi:hypothetical protein